MKFPEYKTLSLEARGEHVLLVRLNRPEVLNAINTQMGRDQLDLWTRLSAEPGKLRAVGGTGAGEDAGRGAGAARDFRARVRRARRVHGAGDRRGERARLRRRAGDGAVL